MEKGSSAPPRGASGIRILEESVGRRDGEALQFVMQRSAFQTQESCGATSSTNLPVRFRVHCQDLAPDLVLEAFGAGFRFKFWNDLRRAEIEGSVASDMDCIERSETSRMTLLISLAY
jgi:hypothetical protein